MLCIYYPVHPVGRPPKGRHENGRNDADASQNLNAVVKPDNAAVAGVAVKLVAVHDEHARR